jgi:hypothetical protein
MPLRVTTVMALQMVLAAFTAAVGIGMQLHGRMMLPGQGFGMYIHREDYVSQREQ